MQNSDAVERATVNVFSHAAAIAAESFGSIGMEHTRPSVVFRAKVFQDGNQWCALIGDDIQSGVCAFGDSPHEATCAFDQAWYAKVKPVSSAPTRTDGGANG